MNAHSENQSLGLGDRESDARPISTGVSASREAGRGTAQQVADQLMAVMDEVGGDGFLIEGSGYNRQLPDLLNGVVPALQKAGAVRTEYRGTTLREILREF